MIIDWSKIKRYVQNRASQPERDEVDMWLKRCEENHRFLDDASSFYDDDFRFFENEERQVAAAWQKVVGRTINKRNKKRVFLRVIATTITVAAAVVAIFFGVYKPKFEESFVVENISIINDKKNDISTVKEAQLILADGSIVKLSQDKDVKKKVADFKIEGNRVEANAEPNIEREPSYNQIIIPKGEIYELILPDSSTVVLNAGTVLSFPTSFSGKERRVMLVGEAYFSIKRNENQPFIVELEDKSCIEVLGTEFNVKARRDDNSETALVSGKVLLHSNAERILLAPGEMCVIDKLSKNYDILTPDMSSLLAWTKGEFIFKNKLLSEIIEDLENWYDVKIDVTNEFVKRKRFHIYISRTNSIEQVMEKLAMTEQISFSKNGKQIIIDNFIR